MTNPSRQISTCASMPTSRLECSLKIHPSWLNSILTAATPSSARASDLLNRISRFSEGVPQCGAIQRCGAPDTIRTCGLRLRRATLYPAELRVPTAYAVLTRILRMSEPQREALASAIQYSFFLTFRTSRLDTCLRRANGSQPCCPPPTEIERPANTWTSQDRFHQKIGGEMPIWR